MDELENTQGESLRQIFEDVYSDASKRRRGQVGLSGQPATVTQVQQVLPLNQQARTEQQVKDRSLANIILFDKEDTRTFKERLADTGRFLGSQITGRDFEDKNQSLLNEIGEGLVEDTVGSRSLAGGVRTVTQGLDANIRLRRSANELDSLKQQSDILLAQFKTAQTPEEKQRVRSLIDENAARILNESAQVDAFSEVAEENTPRKAAGQWTTFASNLLGFGAAGSVGSAVSRSTGSRLAALGAAAVTQGAVSAPFAAVGAELQDAQDFRFGRVATNAAIITGTGALFDAAGLAVARSVSSAKRAVADVLANKALDTTSSLSKNIKEFTNVAEGVQSTRVGTTFSPSRLREEATKIRNTVVSSGNFETIRKSIKPLEEFIPSNLDKDKVLDDITKRLLPIKDRASYATYIDNLVEDLGDASLKAIDVNDTVGRKELESVVTKGRKLSEEIIDETLSKTPQDVSTRNLNLFDSEGISGTVKSSAEKFKKLFEGNPRSAKARVERDIGKRIGVTSFKLPESILFESNKNRVDEIIEEALKKARRSPGYIQAKNDEILRATREEIESLSAKLIEARNLRRFNRITRDEFASRVNPIRERLNQLNDIRSLTEAQRDLAPELARMEEELRNPEKRIETTRRRVRTVSNSLSAKTNYAFRDKRTAFTENEFVDPKDYAKRFRNALYESSKNLIHKFVDPSTIAARGFLRNERFLSEETDFRTSYATKAQANSQLDEFDGRVLRQATRIARDKYGRKGSKVFFSDLDEYFKALRFFELEGFKKSGKKLGSVSPSDKKIVNFDEESLLTEESANRAIKKWENTYANDKSAEAIYDTIRRHIDGKLRYYWEEGLISDKLYNKLVEDHKHYVPFVNTLDKSDAALTFNTSEPTIENIKKIDLDVEDRKLSSVIDAWFSKSSNMNREIADNSVKQSFLRFAKTAESEMSGIIDIRGEKQLPKKPSALQSFLKNAVEVKVRGKDGVVRSEFIGIKPNKNGLDDKALDFLRNNRRDPNMLLKVISSFTRFKSMLTTQINPDFKLRSAMYDIMESHMYTDAIGGFNAKASDLIEGQRDISDFIAGRDTEGARRYSEALQQGIGFGSMSESTRNRYTTTVKEETGLLGAVRELSEGFTNINQHLEGGIVYSNYIAGIRKGYSPNQAARIAREASLNFGVAGQSDWAYYGRAFYMFFNAGVQGSANFVRSMSNPGTAMKVAAATYAMHELQNAWNSAVIANHQQAGKEGFESGHWQNYVDSEYDLSGNVIFFLPGLTKDGTIRRVKLPIAPSMRIPWAVVSNSHDYASGRKTLGRSSGDAFEVLLANTIPVGGRATGVGRSGGDEGSLITAVGGDLTPEFLKPVYNVLTDQDDFGRRVQTQYFDKDAGEYVFPDYFNENDPNAEKISDRTEKLRKFLGPLGNTKLAQKFTDPGSIEELIKGYINFGAIRTTERTAKEVFNLSDDDINLGNVAVVRGLYAQNRPENVWSQRTKLADSMSWAESEEDQRNLIREHVIRTGDTSLKHFLNERGIEVSRIPTFKDFKAGTENAGDFLWLNAESDEEETQAFKEQRIAEMKRAYFSPEKNQQYKYYLEFEVASEGILQRYGKKAVEQYFSDRGIDYGSNMDQIEKKVASIQRYQQPGANEIYDSFTEMKGFLKDDEKVDLQTYVRTQLAQAQLLNNGLITPKEAHSKLAEMNKEYVKYLYRQSVADIEEGYDIDAGLVDNLEMKAQILEQVKSLENQLIMVSSYNKSTKKYEFGSATLGQAAEIYNLDSSLLEGVLNYIEIR